MTDTTPNAPKAAAPAVAEAAEEAKRVARHLFELSDVAEDMVHLSRAIDQLAALAAAPQQVAEPVTSGWISVEDRLPDVSRIEDGETVLVANRGGSFAAEWHGTGITGFSSIHGDQFVQVTHWQPLPAPPSQASATGEV